MRISFKLPRWRLPAILALAAVTVAAIAASVDSSAATPTATRAPATSVPSFGPTVPASTSTPHSTPHNVDVDYVADARFTLQTTIAEGGLRFAGVGGGIDGVLNPALNVGVGQTAQVTLTNGDGVDEICNPAESTVSFASGDVWALWLEFDDPGTECTGTVSMGVHVGCW